MKKLMFLIVLTLTSANYVYPQWFPQNSGTEDHIVKVQFVNDSVGWVLNNIANKIYKTTNGGFEWFLQTSFGASLVHDFFFLNQDLGWFTAGPSGIYKTTDGGDTWNQIYTSSCTEIKTVKFINENYGWCLASVCLDGSILLHTSDGGSTWDAASPTNLYSYTGLVVVDELHLMLTSYQTIFKTTDGGNNWTELPAFNGSYIYDPQFFSMESGWVLVENSPNGFFKTNDGGLNWTLQAQSVSTYYFADNQNGWYVSDSSIYNTVDGGALWTPQNSNTTNSLHDICFVDNNNGWIVGLNGTILYTPNGGLPVELISFIADVTDNNVLLNWQTATETNNQGFEVQRKAFVGDFAAIGFIEGKGTTTEQQNYSFTDKSLSEGKYSYRLKQIDFDGSFEYSKTIEVEIHNPLKFSLSQNYPNPFNPSTKISWQSPVAGWQTLKIYDVLGNLVTTLVDEYKPAGSYEVEFKSTVGSHQLANGIYFYQLKAGNFVETKKMILLK